MRRDQLARIRSAIGPGPVGVQLTAEPHTFHAYALADPDARGLPIEQGNRRVELDAREVADLWPECHFCDRPAAATWTPPTNQPPLRFCVGHLDQYGEEVTKGAGLLTKHRPRRRTA